MASLNQGITDENNDFDGLLALIIGSAVFGIVMTLYDVFILGHLFVFRDFAESVGILSGAGGMGYGAKRLGEKYGSGPPTA